MNKRQLDINLTKAKLCNKNPPIISPKPCNTQKLKTYTDLPPSSVKHKPNEQKTDLALKSRYDATSAPLTTKQYSTDLKNSESSNGPSLASLQSRVEQKSPQMKNFQSRSEQIHKIAAAIPKNIENSSLVNKRWCHRSQVRSLSALEEIHLSVPKSSVVVNAQPHSNEINAKADSSRTACYNMQVSENAERNDHDRAQHQPQAKLLECDGNKSLTDFTHHIEGNKIYDEIPKPDTLVTSFSTNTKKEDVALEMTNAKVSSIAPILHTNTLKNIEEYATPNKKESKVVKACGKSFGFEAQFSFPNSMHGQTTSHPSRQTDFHYDSDVSNCLLDKGKPTEQSLHSQNIKRLKKKFEKEFESKVINSLNSPSEKKSFFSKQNQFNTIPIVSQNKGSHEKAKSFQNQSASFQAKKLLRNDKLVKPQFNASDIPFPYRDATVDVDLIDFTDLPPPPDVIPISSKKEEKQIFNSKVDSENDATEPKGKSQSIETTKHLSFAKDNNSRVSKNLIAVQSVFDQHTEKSVIEANNKSLFDSKRQTEGLKSDHLMQRHVNKKLEKIKTNVTSCNEENLITPDAECHDMSRSMSNFTDDAPKKTVSSNGMKTRDLDEEILYYETMDIMEKIKEKRKEDERVIEQTKSTMMEDIKMQSSSATKETCQISDNKSSTACAETRQSIQEKTIINSLTSESITSSNCQVEFQNAIDDLKYEFLKLKEKLDFEGEAEVPPKIPPKKLKFDHQQTAQSFCDQLSQLGVDMKTYVDPSEVFDQPFSPENTHRLYSEMSASIEEKNCHPTYSIQTVNNQASHAQTPTYSLNSGLGVLSMLLLKEQPDVISEQVNHENTKAKELLMQPLAPIIEEDVDSSSSTSTDSNTNAPDVAVDSSIKFSYELDKHAEYKEENLLSNGKNSFVIKTNENNKVEDRPNMDQETKLESILTPKSHTSTTSFSSSEDAYDLSSMQWEYNLSRSNLKNLKISSPSPTRYHSVDRPLPNIPTIKKSHCDQNDNLNKSQVSRAKDFKSTHSTKHIKPTKKEMTRGSHSFKAFEAKTIQKSEVSKHGKIEETQNVLDAVKPYGILDLSKLHPSFEKDDCFESRPVSMSLEPELTPSSIMYNVSQFNAFMSSMPKTPTKSRCFSFNGESDCSDIPNFPINFNINERQRKIGKERTWSLSSRQEIKFGSKQPLNWEDMKYDNLEKYGAIKKEIEKTQLRKASLSPNYLQSVSTPVNLQAVDEKEAEIVSERDSNFQLEHSLFSKLEKPKKLDTFKYPHVSESQVTRHSSAVRAIDQHNEKQKRLKESKKLKSLASEKAEELQKLWQKNFSFTLPRAHSENSSKDLKHSNIAKTSKSTENIKALEVIKSDYDNVKHANKSFGKSNDFYFAEECPNNKSPNSASKSLSTKTLSKHNCYTDFDLTHVPRFPPTDNFIECLSKDATNTYEEVQGAEESLASKEKQNVKPQVQEILESIQLPEGSYKPKLPLPRYPVEYDNFYPKNSRETEFVPSISAPPNQATTTIGNNFNKSLVSSPVSWLNNEQSIYSDIADTSVHGSTVSKNTHSTGLEHETHQSLPNNSKRAETIVKVSQADLTLTNCSRHISSSTRKKLLSKHVSGGTVDGISISSSDSHLNISVSHQGRIIQSRNSQNKSNSQSSRQEKSHSKQPISPVKQTDHTPSSWKTVPLQTSEENCSSKTLFQSPRKVAARKNRESQRSAAEGLKSKTQKHYSLHDTEGRSVEQSIDTTKGHLVESNMPFSKWGRSKSQDGLSPSRSKSKERHIPEGRPKSQERPTLKNIQTQEVANRKNDEEFKANAHKKEKRRKKSTERTQDGHFNGGRGKSPVKFFKKLLKNKKEESEDAEEDDYIVHVPLGKGGNLSDSTEALTTILAYKGDDVSEKEDWIPPRPNPPQQKVISHGKSSSRPNKANRSPFTNRSKKIRSILASTRSKGDFNSGSSSEGLDQNQRELTPMTDIYGNIGSNRSLLAPAVKPIRSKSRKNSFSSSLPSSDSEQLSKSQEFQNKDRNIIGLRSNFYPSRGKSALKVKRRTYLLNRDYDSDTTVSAFPSDQGSSVGTSSDIDNHGLRSAMKGSSMLKLKGELSGVPKRPVRVISPKKAKSDPTIFSEDEFKNTYYNIEGSKYLKSSTPMSEKNSLLKPVLKEKYQMQRQHQASPTELAYETHRRQKYKTFVTLNAQTLRKVTDQILSQWESQFTYGDSIITAWSDVVLSRPQSLCKIGGSAIYSIATFKNDAFRGACQLFARKKVDDQTLCRLEEWKSLPIHPNVCGVSNHFLCHIPVNLMDTGSDLTDVRCAILNNRPSQPLQEFLNEIAGKGELTEHHRQVLINILQLLQGIEHLNSFGFNLSCINPEQLFIIEDRQFLQILPHLDYPQTATKKSSGLDLVLKAYQSSDSDSANSSTPEPFSIIQEVGNLMKSILQNGDLILSSSVLSQAEQRDLTTLSLRKVVMPGTKYSSAIKCLINYFKQSPPVDVKKAIDVTQCALWGPEDIDDVGVDDVSPYSAMELWIEMQQVKLVNNLAVLSSNDRLKPSMFFKHKYFASVVPGDIFDGLKVLQRC